MCSRPIPIAADDVVTLSVRLERRLFDSLATGWHGFRAHRYTAAANRDRAISGHLEHAADKLGHSHIPGSEFAEATVLGDKEMVDFFAAKDDEKASAQEMKVHGALHQSSSRPPPPPAKAPAAGAGDDEDDADGGGPNPAPVKRFVAIVLLPAFWL
jgi:hypothetical protein